VFTRAVPVLLALLHPSKGTRVVETASTALDLASQDEPTAVLIYNTGYDAIISAIATRTDRVQRTKDFLSLTCLST
jgi:hypothetical protein